MAPKKILSIVYIVLAITFLLKFQPIEGRQLNYGAANVTSRVHGDVVNIPPPQNSNNTRMVDKIDPRNSAPPAPQSQRPIHN
ncbi:hypothetical protein SLEP1_g9320 [Rubroshorea leprosula]|uniref:Uncharacterized protein n=1 Tax=Rubroshorea leprosula TaxID=152421 RepID=A0AAV5IFS3_9ROSI|nr:hypothetical protein SLEP1_g9320 [Rubroshorea leprosula]